MAVNKLLRQIFIWSKIQRTEKNQHSGNPIALRGKLLAKKHAFLTK
jgi:hypothetical protein